MTKHKSKRKINPLLVILILILLGIFIFSGYKLISTMLEYRKSAQEYDNLRGYTDEDAADKKHVLTAEEVASGQLKCPISVDFDALKEINEDIIGWIYIKDVDISYPITQSKDNDYYLHRTFRRTYNFAGSIFADFENASDFSDPNTILYGHNMKNDSMFGRLDELVEKEKDLEEPYFWILVPGAEYCYAMFDMQRVDPYDEIYTLFHGTDETFVQYAEKCAEESSVELPAQKFTTDSKIVTLSTCTNDSKARFVVQGVRVGTVNHTPDENAGPAGSSGDDDSSRDKSEEKSSGGQEDEYSQFVTETE